MDLSKIQHLLSASRLDGWLFTDFHGHDFISRDFLELTERKCTRRLFYYIPAGEGKNNQIIKISSWTGP